jgi:hypothetical protein
MRVTLLALCIASASAFAPTRPLHAPGRSKIVARLGDLSGDTSRRLDTKTGKIWQTDNKGARKVFATKALGDFEALDVELAECDDLPSAWIIKAEEEYREAQRKSHSALDDSSY